MDDSAWEAHKAEIERLHMKGGKTLEEVKEMLELTRGFRGRYEPSILVLVIVNKPSWSKKQYERAFKKWGFRKYKMNPDRWKFINRELQKRKRESDVYVYGVRYPPEKIQK